VSHVELVMEVDGSLTEILFNFSVKSESSLDDWYNLLLDCSLELIEVLADKGVIDCEERSLLREGNSKGPEVTLKSRVNLERTSCRVHACCVQGVLNILESKLGTIIPMFIVLVLSQE
jgi:hypothetical protein